MWQKVFLLDSSNSEHVVVVGEVSGNWRNGDLFNLKDIPKGFIRVGVVEVLEPTFPLMHLYEATDQVVVGDVMNSLALWKEINISDTTHDL